MTIILLCCVVAAVLLADWQLERRREGKGLFAGEYATSGVGRRGSGARLFGMPQAVRSAVFKELARVEGAGALHFHPGHSWAREREGGIVETGADEMTGKILGAVETVELPEVGARVTQGRPAWTLKRGGREVTQVAPVSGVVAEVNSAVAAQPTLVNAAPYGRGWLVRIKGDGLAAGLTNLFTGALADAWLAVSFARVNAVFSPEVHGVRATAQDGGLLVDNLGDSMTEEQWLAIRRELFEK